METFVRILGLDTGSKRIGVAVSDELGFTAQALDTIQCKDIDSDIDRIRHLVKEYSVDEIVIGIPYNMNGTEGPQVQRVRDFMKLLSLRINVPLFEWDERLTSAAAERVLLEADMSRAKRRKVIDKLAAALILQGYLDRKGFEGSRQP